MPFLPHEISDLLASIENGALVLTPNHRTSTQLLDWYGAYYKSKNQTSVYPSPAVFPVDIWIRQQYEALIYSGSNKMPPFTLLDSGQEKLLWQKIISESDSGKRLLNKASTARAVQEAWTLIHLWQIEPEELAVYKTTGGNNPKDDLSAYLEWSGSFSDFCQENKLITLVQLLGQLIPLIEDNAIEIPDNIILSGFKQSPPLYQKLLDRLIAHATNAQIHEINKCAPGIRKLSVDSAETEIVEAARWAKNCLEKDTNAYVGIIVPDLYNKQALVQRIFSRVFADTETVTLRKTAGYPFALSVSESISKQPMIQAAFRILGLNNYYSDAHDVFNILRSPFFLASDSEESQRAHLEIYLRKKNILQINNSDLRFYASMEKSDFYSPQLADALLAFDQAKMPESRHKKSLREWGEIFEKQLSAFGWPGARSPSDMELINLKSWSQLLADFYQLTVLYQQVMLEEALEILQLLAENTSVKQGNNQLKVLVLTPTEADGLIFTDCWMTGLSEKQWPSPPDLSPFIPYALQKSKGFPGADINLHTEASRRFLTDLAGHTTASLHFSYAANDQDIPLNPAAMLQEFHGDFIPIDHSSTENLLHPLTQQQDLITELELLKDAENILLTDSEKRGGGYQLLADQAECPFRSFARHRLDAKPLEKLVPGLSARDAGTLVHLVLEMFWHSMQSQEALLAYKPTDLKKIIQEIIDDAVRETAVKHKVTMTANFCTLEKSRLFDLLMQWLEEERRRGSFTVLKNECDVQWQFSELKLKLRIDRVDQLEDGRLVLIDYKSSRNTSVDWEDERPSNPQLVLYEQAVSQDTSQLGSVAAMFYAQVNIENTQYKGLSADKGIYPGNSIEELAGKYNGLAENATWESLKNLWQHSLALLAEEFLNGRASISPKRISSCLHCPVKPVCRIEEVLVP